MDKNKFNLVVEQSEIYILCFDEYKGHYPLLVYPDENIILNKEKMHTILTHPIWFLDVKEKPPDDHIDMVYGKRVYLAKKYKTISKRKKKRAGLNINSLETIILMLSLPSELFPYGINFLDIISRKIIRSFGSILYKMIEFEYAKEEIIRTPLITDIISEGKSIKEDIIFLIKNTVKEYSDTARKPSELIDFLPQKIYP
jgi:hypothetical protein